MIRRIRRRTILWRAAYVENYNFDVPEGMELMVYNRCRPDGGEARSVDTVDMVPMCQTVSCELDRMNPVTHQERTPL